MVHEFPLSSTEFKSLVPDFSTTTRTVSNFLTLISVVLRLADWCGFTLLRSNVLLIWFKWLIDCMLCGPCRAYMNMEPPIVRFQIRFSLKSVLTLLALVALGLGWTLDHHHQTRKLVAVRKQLESEYTRSKNASSRANEISARVYLVRNLIKFPEDQSGIVENTLLEIILDSWRFQQLYPEFNNQGDADCSVWHLNCNDAMELLGLNSAAAYIAKQSKTLEDPEYFPVLHDKSSAKYKSLVQFINTSLNDKYKRDWKW